MVSQTLSATGKIIDKTPWALAASSALRAGVGYASSYVSNRLAGNNPHFNWNSVAASVVSSGIGSGVNLGSGYVDSVITANMGAWIEDKWFGGVRPDYKDVSLNAIANTLGSSIANGSLITQTKSLFSRFGDARSISMPVPTAEFTDTDSSGAQSNGFNFDGLEQSVGNILGGVPSENGFSDSGLNVSSVSDGLGQGMVDAFNAMPASDDDTGFRFYEHTPEGDRLNAELAAYANNELDLLVQNNRPIKRFEPNNNIISDHASPYEMTLTGSPSDGDIPPPVIPASRSKDSLSRRYDAVSEWLDASTPLSLSFVQTQATGNPLIDNTLLRVAQIGDMAYNAVSNTAKAAGNLAILGLNAPAGVFSAVSGDYDESQRQWDALLLSTPITTGFSGVGQYLRSARTINAASPRNMGVMGSQRGMIDPRLVDEARIGANSGRTSYRSADVVIPSENINLSGSYFKFTPNAMLGHEVTQVSNFLADIKRGIFTGVPSLPKGSLINGKSISSSDYPVIDGWYQHNIGGREVPISLKAITSDNPLSILQDVSKANKTGLNFGIKDVVMLVDAPNMNIDRLVKFASEGPLTGKALQQGVINRVVIKTPKGYVTINPGSTIRDLPKEW